jgi:threonylcarbamoyladenosine tRNA methylthiotransferase MtaB
LDLLHIFPFSPHDNTPASKMPQVPKAIIKQRAAILRQEAEICLQRVLNRFVGKEETMLVERIENGIVHGKTDHYLSCQFSKNESVCCVGDIVKIRISGIEKNILTN